jgi:hypothetical protein
MTSNSRISTLLNCSIISLLVLQVMVRLLLWTICPSDGELVACDSSSSSSSSSRRRVSNNRIPWIDCSRLESTDCLFFSSSRLSQ